MAASNLGKKIRSNTAWVMGGNLTHRLYKFAIGIILARILFPEDFGLLVTIQIFTGALGFVAGGGMGAALIQSKEVTDRDFHVVFTAQIAICAAIYALLFLLAPYFAIWFDDPRYTYLLRISAISFLLRPFSNVSRSRLVREMRFKELTIIRLIGMLFSSLTSVLLALNGFGPLALILGGFAGTLSGMIMMISVTRFLPRFAMDKKILKRLGGYGIKVSANEIILHFRNQAPNFFVSTGLGPGAVGLFNKADSLATLPTTIFAGSAYQTIFRALSSIQDNLDQSKYVYYRTITLLSVYTLPFYVGFLWVAEPFIRFVYGEKWAPAALPLQILSAVGMFRSINMASGAVIAAQNRLGTEIRIQLEALLLFALAAFLGSRYDIAMVAYALVPCYLYFTYRMTSLANRCIEGSHGKLAKSLAPAIYLNSALFLTLLTINLLLPKSFSTGSPGQYLIINATLGGLVYSVLFFLLPLKELDTEKERWRNRLLPPGFFSRLSINKR